MGHLPPREEFYAERDSRTDRIAPNQDYRNFQVRLMAGAATVCTYPGQVQLLTAANMLARWCRHVELGFPDAPLVDALQLPSHQTLHQRIAAEMEAADPYGLFVFTSTSSPTVQYVLKAGSASVAEPVDFTVDSDGWTVRAAQGNAAFSLEEDYHNPVGPALAACIGVADAFKVAVGEPSSMRVQTFTRSLFDLRLKEPSIIQPQSLPAHIELGHVCIVGVGSVGSAVVYLLRMLPLRGTFTLIDHDPVKLVNLNRSPLFGYRDVCRAKVAVAKAHLQSSVLVHAFTDTYAAFIDQQGRPPVDVLLALANEQGVRSTIENNFPPVQVYGSTFEWGMNYHRHIPLVDDCSLCRFPVEAGTLPTVCSTAKVEVAENEQLDAALPFASMGAAALTVAGLIRLQYPGYTNMPNFASIDLKGDLGVVPTYSKRPQPSCSCGGRNKKLQARFIQPTRFASLSQEQE
jgi:hypothetical protein